jgi:hypothetical protein
MSAPKLLLGLGLVIALLALSAFVDPDADAARTIAYFAGIVAGFLVARAR